MPRQLGSTVENNFVQGLITDSTGLNFPENAVTDSDNCIFDDNGSVRPRLGFDFEENYSLRTIDRANVVVGSFYWKGAAGSGTHNFLVLQVGDTLYLYKVSSDAVSNDFKDSIDLTTFSPSGGLDPSQNECQYASGLGYLFVTHPYLESFYIQYDPDADSFSANQIDLQIRDFDGLDDSLDVDEEPSVLSDEHKYNLFNQGWIAAGTNRNAHYEDWFTEHSVYPSNAQQWWVYKKIDTSSDGDPVFAPELRDRFSFRNAPAPKGHFILDVYNQDRSDVSGITGFTVTTSGVNRASAVAFFSGRVFYAGVSSQDYSTDIYFSKIVENTDDFGKCYQENDPTSEDVSDLLPSDGGVIRIPDIGNIVKLAVVHNTLFVFANNGVWAISGSEGLGFRANDYSVDFVSSILAVSPTNFVTIEGVPAWWNQDGIYILENQGQLGGGQVKRLTEDKIDELFEDLPSLSKENAKGAYNPVTKIVQWVYRSTETSTLTEDYTYDKILNFNVKTGAFYIWSPDTTNVSINGIFTVTGEGVSYSVEDVVDEADDTVIDSNMDTVQAVISDKTSRSTAFRYICSYPDSGSYEFTFAETSNTDYKDWFEFDSTGVDITAYFLTGYKIHGDAQRKFQSNYVWLYTEPGSSPSQLFFQARWDFATSGNTGRWSTKSKIVFDGGNYGYEFKKIKTRGHGRILQYYVENVPGEPFDLIGWSVFESANQLP